MAKAHGKIPDTAKQVFAGVLFNVYQWQQTMFDGTTQTFERVKRPDTVQIIAITPEKKIILLKEQQPDMSEALISIPGGRMDKEGEDALDAAKRELLEETGYETSSMVLWFSERPVSKLEWTVYTFVAKGCVPVQEKALDSGERIEMQLVTFEDFLQLLLREDYTATDDVTRVVLRMLMGGRRAELETLFFK